MKHAGLRGRFVITLAGLGLAACTGSITGNDPEGTDPGNPGQGPGAATPPSAGPPAAGQLRRLTANQFRRALQDLLGGSVAVEVEDPPISTSLRAIGASITAVSPRGVEQFETAVDAALGPVFGDPRRRQAVVGCDPAAAWDAACARTFVEGFGLRAWRRPLLADEVQRYLALGEEEAKAAGRFVDGVQAIASALLQSPHFLYRVELGAAPAAGKGWARYGGFEIATRMSFLLWGTTPDAALLAAARSGALETRDGMRSQAQRLLDSPRVADGLADLVDDLMALDGVAIMAKDPKVFPQLTPTLRQAMRDEVVLLFKDTALKRDADLMELFDTDRTFVNAELGKLYGIDVRGNEPVEARHPAGVPRAGLLTAAALITPQDKTHETSPTRRGALIRNSFFCDHVPDPPPGVDTSPRPLPPGVVITRRESLAQHSTDAACRPCHDLMDPIGLALENFDAMGIYRRTDENGLAIDTGGTIDGTSFAGPRELGAMMRQSPKVRDCVTRWIYRYATGREENDYDKVQIERLVQDFAGATVRQRLKPLLSTLLLSDGFLNVSPPR
jgi:hypothetical protein